MDAHIPQITVALPVYNGEAFLAQSIESILAQSFRDFELIIADNASTDSTPAIARAYAARDPRIRYVGSERNQGAAWNFNRAFAMARGPYFKWHAADDLLEPAFLERCLAALEAEPRAVLAFSRTRIIDIAGETVEHYHCPLRADDPQPHVRFRDVACVTHRCFEVFGLIRREALASTRLIDSFVGSDRVLLARLALIGQFIELPDELFISRRHAGQSVKIKFRARAAWFDTNRPSQVVLPQWRNLIELARQIAASDLAPAERARSYAHLLHYVRTNKNWARLGYDLFYAGRQVAALAATPVLRRARTGSS